jgi:hypothetical protein
MIPQSSSPATGNPGGPAFGSPAPVSQRVVPTGTTGTTRLIVRRPVDPRDPPAVTAREFRRHRLARLADVAVILGRWDDADRQELADPWRLPVEPIADAPPVVPTRTGYAVPAFVAVAAWPHRTADDARELAERVAARPLAYLPLVLAMPGVADLRVTFGKGAARAT